MAMMSGDKGRSARGRYRSCTFGRCRTEANQDRTDEDRYGTAGRSTEARASFPKQSSKHFGSEPSSRIASPLSQVERHARMQVHQEQPLP